MAVNSLKFGNSIIDMANFGVRVASVSNTLLPVVNPVTVQKPGGLGHVILRQNLSLRSIAVELKLIADSRQSQLAAQRKLAAALVKETEAFTKTAVLQIADSPVTYNATIQGSSAIVNMRKTGEVILNFVCYDPFGYGQEQTVVLVDGVVKEIENEGGYPATGVITVNITGEVNEIVAELMDTGKKIIIEHDFIADDVVEILLDVEEVKKNGLDITVDCDIQSSFFDLPVGEFDLKVTGGDGELKYTERWL